MSRVAYPMSATQGGYCLNLFMEIVLIAAPFDRIVDLFYT